MRFRSAAVLLLTLFAGSPAVADGQWVPEPKWGIAEPIDVVVGAWDFEPELPTMTPLVASNGNRLGGTGVDTYRAHVQLPAGAIVLGVEIVACVNSLLNGVSIQLVETGPVGFDVPRGAASSSGPACGKRMNTVTPFIIDNYNSVYSLRVNLGDPLNSFSAARVYYVLQVSPAPATARFTDVPTTHPFFQFIEALASSGITSGCGPTTFCPDAPVTRGQLAVFLSRALGLHWPH